LNTEAEVVRKAIRHATRGLVERDTLVELTVLAAVAREHLLVIGPPGTAKSEAVRRAGKSFEARYFEYLLGRFTEPSELVGPIDLRRLREGIVETETSGMLPEAELAFLNTLLSLLHERSFRRGKTTITVPLRVCVAASNALPEDESLAAFADRFLLRVFVEPVPDAMLETLLTQGASKPEKSPVKATLKDLDTLAERAQQCDVSPLRATLAEAVRILRKQGIALSDRRIVKLQKLVAAAAAMEGRDRAEARDLWPILYALPTAEAQTQGRAALADLLKDSANSALTSAALDASNGPLARAARIAEEAREVLTQAASTPDASRQKRLKVEAMLREIDASFAERARPPALTEVRTLLQQALTASAT
jgi:MoxR-like ATPase